MDRKGYKKKGKKGKRKYGRRKYRRRGKRSSKVNPVVTHLPFGQSQKVNHRYVETITLGTSVGVRGVYTFMINAMYDPNVTGAGHQPLGFDQMSLMFQKYTVVGVKIKARFMNTDTDEYISAGIYLSEQATVTLTPDELMEQGALNWRVLPPLGTNSDNGKPVTLSSNVSIKKFCHVTNVLDNDYLTTNNTANPTRPVYAHLVVWQPVGGSTTANTKCIVQIDQCVIWTSPLTLGQS